MTFGDQPYTERQQTNGVKAWTYQATELNTSGRAPDPDPLLCERYIFLLFKPLLAEYRVNYS